MPIELALQTRVCPLLERESETRILDVAPEPWIVRQCVETGLVYLENPPQYESFDVDFAWEVTHQQEVERRAQAEPLSYALRSRFKRFRARWLSFDKTCYLASRQLREVGAGQLSLVELGCGTGKNLVRTLARLPPSIAQRCCAAGVEISRKLANHAHHVLQAQGGRCVHDNALSGLTQFPRESIDVVILSSFLEHEVNPLPLLRRCRERLRKGGSIVIKVPNYNCWNRHLRGNRWCGFRWPDHVNYFTPQTLQTLVRNAGFQISRMTFWDNQPLSDNMYAIIKNGD